MKTYQLTDKENEAIEKKVRQMSNFNFLQKLTIVTHILSENQTMVNKINELRAQRQMDRIQSEPEYQQAINILEQSGTQNKPALVARRALFLNVQLTREYQEHAAALGMPLLKTFEI